jgi:hypothetical protein
LFATSAWIDRSRYVRSAQSIRFTTARMGLRLLRYFATLTTGRVVLWCYAIWYAVNVAQHFDPRPRLWITSAGLGAIIGAALWISTRSASNGTTKLDGWQVFRLFLMPFCVSSFAALVKDAGYILIFSPSLRENLIGFGAIAAFLVVINALRRRARPCP